MFFIIGPIWLHIRSILDFVSAPLILIILLSLSLLCWNLSFWHRARRWSHAQITAWAPSAWWPWLQKTPCVVYIVLTQAELVGEKMLERKFDKKKSDSRLVLFLAGGLNVRLRWLLSLFLNLGSWNQSSIRLVCNVTLNYETLGAKRSIDVWNSLKKSIVLLDGKRNTLFN